MPAFAALKVGISTLTPECPITQGRDSHLELIHGLVLQASLKDISGLILVPADRGGFAIDLSQLARLRPDLPIVEQFRLADPASREHFLMRIHAYAAWQKLRTPGLSRSALVDFHSRYKYQLMACSPHAYRELGRRLGQNTEQPQAAFINSYCSALMEALSILPTPGSHCNTLMHLSGYFRRQLDAAERQELEDSILQYRRGIEPLARPLALLRRHLRNHPNPYLSKQIYLQPYPDLLAAAVCPAADQ